MESFVSFKLVVSRGDLNFFVLNIELFAFTGDDKLYMFSIDETLCDLTSGLFLELSCFIFEIFFFMSGVVFAVTYSLPTE